MMCATFSHSLLNGITHPLLTNKGTWKYNSVMFSVEDLKYLSTGITVYHTLHYSREVWRPILISYRELLRLLFSKQADFQCWSQMLKLIYTVSTYLVIIPT